MGVDLDSEQNNLIAEYAAGVLIKHSYNHSNRYEFSASEDETEEEPTVEPEKPTDEGETVEPEKPSGEDETKKPDKPTEEDESKPEKPTSSEEETTTAPEEFKFEEVLGFENISVECDGYEVTESLDADPNGLFELVAETGYKFVVVNYMLTNTSEEEITVNTADKNIILKACFNNDYKYNNYDASILGNDLTVLKDVLIKAGAEYKAVTIFMVPEDVVDSIDSFIITVASDNNIEGVYTIE